MNRKSFIMTLILVALMAGAVMAVDVTITGDTTGTYTLNSMSIASDGSVALSVSSGGTPPPPPPPGTPSLGISPNTLPGGTDGSAYSQNAVMSASGGTSPYTYSCFGTGVSGINVTAGSSSCTISGTPSGTGSYSVTFRVDDDAGQSGQITRSFTINAVPTPPGEGEPPIKATLSNGVSVRFVEINAGETHYYKFTIPQSQSGGWHGMLVSMGTNDWRTNQDMMFSLGLPSPSTSDYTVGETIALNGQVINGSQKWANISRGSSNESVQISSGLPAGTYYIMVYNTSGSDGVYELYYSAW